MAKQETLQAEKRDVKGTTASKRLRRAGTVPAIVYGSSQDNYTIQVNSKEFSDIFKKQSSENFLVNLQIADAKEKEKLAFIQDIQRDSLSGEFIHIDFQAVSETETIHAEIPLVLEGESPGVKGGGVLEHLLHTIDIECRPAALPDHIAVSIEDLEVGDSSNVGDINFPDGVISKMDENVIVVLVAAPRVEEVTEEVAEEGAEGEEAAGEDGEKAEAAGEGGE